MITVTPAEPGHVDEIAMLADEWTVFETAAHHGCSRVEWTTDRDNAGAQAFYASLGFGQSRSKIVYRAEGRDLITPP